MGSRKPKPIDLKNLTHEHNRVVGLLAKESDRSAAIVGGAFLDDLLGEMLKAHFIDDKKLQEALLLENRPLGAFSARIDIAFALGLIPRSIHTDLHRIRQIRNAFAHDRELTDFASDASMRDQCGNLSPKYQSPHVPKFEPRTQFVLTLAWLMHEIQFAEVPRLSVRQEIPVRHIPPPASEQTGG